MKTNRKIDNRAPRIRKARQLQWDDMRRHGSKRVAMALSVVLGLVTTLCLTCCSI